MDLGLESTIVMTAVRMIRRKGFVPSEDSLLEVIANPRTPMELNWAVLALGEWGTVKSVPVLKELTSFPKQDVQIAVVHKIGKIAGASETKFYCDLLESPTYKEKGTAMWMIADFADDSALPAVLAYFEKNMAKIKKGQLVNDTCNHGAIYLLRVSSLQPLAKAFLDAHVGLLLDNTEEMQLRGWNELHGRAKHEWIADLFALADRPLPSYVTGKPA
jgi:hypothetical protein